MALRIFALIFALLSSQAFAGLFDNQSKSQFVPVDRAFAFDFQQSENRLTLNWQIKPGYYLYRQQISLNPVRAELAPLALPKGSWHEDEFYGKTEIYTKQLNLPVTIQSAAKGATVSVTYQGCAEAGFCYPPETRVVPLSEVVAVNEGRPHSDSLPQEREKTHAAASSSSLSPAEGVGAWGSDNTATAQLPFSALWAFLIGIGIAFTPCVLPMYPLISGIVLGGKQRLSTARALLLTFVYVQGMALTYTALGLVVAAAGLQFQAALQHPYVLIGLSALFILLAASMFGLFTLQLPSSLQTRLTLMSNRQQGGSAGGVFAMGALAGLICSPCTTAPLSAILLYIAQSGNMWLGGGTLYLYATGMGLPLILITVFGNRLLPKSGPWMETVKTAFGFVILALPVFLLERILEEPWGIRLWGLLGVAFFSWAFITSLQATKSWMRVVQIILLGAALVAAKPLQDWAFATPAATSQAHLSFSKIANVEQLDQALAEAKGKPVMLDLYADWCVACKEFEKYTFSDPQVQQQLANTVLLQADVTANNAQDVRLLKHLQVLGLPTILFFDKAGREQPNARVTGFMDADTFRAHLHNHAQ
ncbi:protein-disulfide reductase DsbD [Buttiauxella warmboldiae]|uniref:Thiol:disulfide interchange protein DsbD n=1 Tax=Buttiauxella warmboldiae TaxID=82993 RepID=A0A3N5EAM7_9ENTR|nr:protein-disulfide reductase DsbD [Buttiauxella warmboldiae]RPH28616.1 protein-disulfide reductase DsbD [Buttiauxella warmboldiae]